MTAQITVRTDDELVERVKAASARAGRSMNDYVSSVLDAATNPDLAGSLAENVRDRLARAGLLLDEPEDGDETVRHPIDSDRFNAARRRAGTGTTLASLVADGR